ncbi:MAG: glycosyltransferase [Thermodesulfobacteriota bacterium]
MNRAISITSSSDLSPQPLPSSIRPVVKGKFIYVGDEKLYIRGVTYGAFRPDKNGNEYHNLEVIDRDFAQMAANGLNAVRIPHTIPPISMLDTAERYGLRVMVGLSAEQFVGYLIDKKNAPNIEEIISSKVCSISGHPALLCYAIGNEIQASIVRWLGHSKIEDYLKRIYNVVKEEDPDGVVTYVNYPTTEYLHLPFLELVCFNVYLETKERLDAYLLHLQTIAKDRPLILSELGLDSLRNGVEKQAEVLDWQIRSTFKAGCAGGFIFSWTDEWYRAGSNVYDWKFGITDWDRNPKPALETVRKTFADVPFQKNELTWPRFSVVVCTYNGRNTIGECLEGLARIEYANFEVIIINDGSNKSTSEIITNYANKHGFRLITTENRGLSSARNTGLEAATGEIVAFIDDDAYPDPYWLKYLAIDFTRTNHVGVGGPNIPPPGDGRISECIAKAPGNPSHVLISDHEAEHIPGCNMAYRREALLAVGGFDPQFRIAGDDVDICWMLQKKGWSIGFSPSAVVWHHRRNSLYSYWNQQLNYGKAEALLERKWPEKYNGLGNCNWTGRLYGNGFTKLLGLSNGRIYHGMWGSAPFQTLHQTNLGLIQSLPLIPEWYLIIFGLLMLSCIGFFWKPLLFTLPFFVLALVAPIAQSVMSASKVCFPFKPRSRFEMFKMHVLTSTLYITQPLARLFGRLSSGLTPWRRHGLSHLSFPWPRTHSFWSENWQEPEKTIEFLETLIRNQGGVVLLGGGYDKWDLEIRGGLFGSLRILCAVEDHGGGKQMIRLRSWPKISPMGFVLTLFFTVLAIFASIDKAWYMYVILGVTASLTAVRSFGDCAVSTASFLKAIKQLGKECS